MLCDVSVMLRCIGLALCLHHLAWQLVRLVGIARRARFLTGRGRLAQPTGERLSSYTTQRKHANVLSVSVASLARLSPLSFPSRAQSPC